jgi:5-bromo-4-chloroindolyl phosphate hydrolysis protein
LNTRELEEARQNIKGKFFLRKTVKKMNALDSSQEETEGINFSRSS